MKLLKLKIANYTPSHPTPASAEWRQLWDRIGLLWHSSSWLELEVHWTSSRKIGPLPIPKWALLYALPPAHEGILILHHHGICTTVQYATVGVHVLQTSWTQSTFKNQSAGYRKAQRFCVMLSCILWTSWVQALLVRCRFCFTLEVIISVVSLKCEYSLCTWK